MTIPLFATSLDSHLPRLTARLASVAESGKYILGPEVTAFEDEFARYLGVSHCVGVANGTDALTVGLRALGVSPGDEVVVPSLTFYATAEAAVNAGAVPVFCDVDPETLCVTAETVRPVLTERTKAIVPVHLFGNVAPVPELRALGVPVLEDAAQAAGAALGGVRAGALGHAATFSFFPSKNLPCLGDGGAITTDSDEVAERARQLRFHGSVDKTVHTHVGYNSRLDSLQAAVLRELLPELDGWNERRRAAAGAYERAGLGTHVRLPVPVDGASHVHHLYVVRSDDPDVLVETLAAAGVQARRYYATPVHRQPAMERYAAGVSLPATEEAARSIVALPMGPELTDEQVGEVVAALTP
ncbi:MAG: DegT/DnrJ/EryC1/StrS family aminotransferase [Thermoleophilaceae bacterium]